MQEQDEKVFPELKKKLTDLQQGGDKGYIIIESADKETDRANF